MERRTGWRVFSMSAIAPDGYYIELAKQYRNPESLVYKKLQLISTQIKSGNKLLDIGCGTGDLILGIKDKFKRIIGLDVNTHAVNACKERFRGFHHIEFLASDAEKLPFHSNSFDCITALDCLEHLSNPELTVNEVHRVLSFGGELIVTTPNWYDKLFRRIRPSLHKHSHSSLGWKRMILRNRFRINNIRTVAFPVINRDCLSKHLHILGKCVFIRAQKTSVLNGSSPRH